MKRSLIAFLLSCAVALPALGEAQTNDVLATLDGQPITEALADEIAPQIMGKARAAWYEARRAATDEVIARLLIEREAKRRGITADQLLDAEVGAKVPRITDAEIKDFYEKNRSRIQGKLEDVAPQIERYLKQQHASLESNRLITQLRLGSKVAYMISPPKVEVAAIGPSKGSPTAPVTIVEFSDFECFFCRRAVPMLQSLLDAYPNNVRIVFRDFPMDSHPAARVAAEAARCANDQGKFWEYHDLLFANQGKLGVDALKQYAQQLSLNADDFSTCLTSRKHKAAVDRDIEDGRKVAVSGTPTFFVNGRAVVGAQPIESFRAVIDEELAKVQRADTK